MNCSCVHHPPDEPCQRKRQAKRTTCSTCRYFCPSLKEVTS